MGEVDMGETFPADHFKLVTCQSDGGGGFGSHAC